MSTLKDRILAHIRETGPMSVGAYMSWCLLDPAQGYYPTRDPLGIDGDFITAPEISQMFGEVLGLWLIDRWRSLDKPEIIHLVEYGPGRGVMMSDIVRAARLDKDFATALHIWLIETSAALEGKQAENLGATASPVHWVDRLEEVPEGPSLILGNEYLDCLPVRQFIMKDRFKGAGGWHERLVGESAEMPGVLEYQISPVPVAKADTALLPLDLPPFKDGDLLEVHPGAEQIVETIKTRFKQQPGAALFIDYGPEATEYGDTFQALHKHKKVDPLDAPGAADLTVRVNFSAMKHWGQEAGLAVYGPVSQGTFLSRLGIEVRAVALSRAKPEAKPKIARQLYRLMDASEMGSLFKAICLQSADLPVPLGFEQ